MRTPPLDHLLVSALKKLKLGFLVDTLPERLVLAKKQDMSFEELLLFVLSDEITRRDSTSTIRRAKAAGLDPAMMIERWDTSSKVSFDKRLLNELMSLRFLENHENVVVLGPVGVGKTFLATALGHVACRHRYRSTSPEPTKCCESCVRADSTTRAKLS
jgi:DNA replication protein DnaC